MYVDRKYLNSENSKVMRSFLFNQHHTDSFILRHEQYYYTFTFVFDLGINSTALISRYIIFNKVDIELQRFLDRFRLLAKMIYSTRRLKP